MTTIDKLDLNVYNLYAIRTKMIEQINQQLQLDKAHAIPPQTYIVDVVPKLTELDIILGVVPLNVPWAYFFPPPLLRAQRKSPFAFSRIMPSLGNDEEQEEDMQLIEKVEARNGEEKEEKEAILQCFRQIKTINKWMSFIVGRVGQFLQG